MTILDSDDVKIDILRQKNDGLSVRNISERTGVPKSTLSDFLNGHTYREFWDQIKDKPIADGYIEDHHKKMQEFPNTRYIITSAQNNTYVHTQFLQSLETYADYLDAKIIVGTFSYNKNGFQNLEKGEADWFDPKISDYVIDAPVKLCDGLIYCGELNILPTAVNPLSGLQSYTKNKSGIVPHAKLELESMPTHKFKETRMMYTTGTVTKRNYIAKKAGQKAEFDHVFSALVVEVDSDGDWFVRQLISDKSGAFYDMDLFIDQDGVYGHDGVKAITWGDLHSEKADEQAFYASFDPSNPDNMLDKLRPEYQFVHDAMDFEARNHHNINDPYHNFEMHVKGKETIEHNLEQTANSLRLMDRPGMGCQTIVVESNHDLALKKWLRETDYRRDPANALFFLRCQLAQYEAIRAGNDDFHVFEYALKQQAPDLTHVRFLRTDESFMLGDEEKGIECGQHGHNGANGAKGSVHVFKKTGTKHNVAHTHTACIKSGVYYAGILASLDCGYNVGASSWSHSNVITHMNMKRQIITIKNGKTHAKD